MNSGQAAEAENIMIEKLTINTGEQVIELSLDEAKALHRELEMLFGDKQASSPWTPSPSVPVSPYNPNPWPQYPTITWYKQPPPQKWATSGVITTGSYEPI